MALGKQEHIEKITERSHCSKKFSFKEPAERDSKYWCKRCQCVYLLSSHTTKRSYNINYQLDCNSNNVVYFTCKVCGLQCVGSTSTKFRLRFNNRKSTLRAHSRKSNIHKESDDFVYKHFHGPGHHGLRDVSVQIIDKVHNNEKLFIKEGEWGYRLQTLKPVGLNDRDYF